MKKNFKRTVASLLAVVMILCATPLSGFVGLELPSFSELFGVNAEAESYSGTYGDIIWSLDTYTGVLTISGTGAIPSGAFSEELLSWTPGLIRTVLIEYGITSIGTVAFFGCSKLSSVTIPNSVTSIAGGVFYNCQNLRNITIPDSVTDIDETAFMYCPFLNITVDQNNEHYLSEDGALFTKDKTVLIQYPIGKTDTSYTICNGVVNIGESAFWGCTNLSSVTIPISVTNISKNAFANSSIRDVYYQGTESDREKISIGTNNDPLLSATWHYNVETPHEHNYDAFLYYQTDHPHYAVYKCSCGAENVTTETTTVDSCEICNPHVCRFTFSNYQPAHPHYAVYKCSCGKEQVDYSEMLMFDDCETCNPPHVCGFYFCEYQTEHPHYAVYECSCGKTKIEKSETITSSVCEVCQKNGLPVSDLFEYTVENGEAIITSLKNENITNLVVPEKIGEYSVTRIDDWAFYDCTSIESVIISEGVKKIGHNAFSGCTELTSITIPTSVTRIDIGAFSGSGVTDVYYTGSESDKGNIDISPSGNYEIENATWHYNYTPETKISYTINFYDGDTLLGSKTLELDEDGTLSYGKIPSKDGYKFVGWSNIKGGPALFNDGMAIKNLATENGA